MNTLGNVQARAYPIIKDNNSNRPIYGVIVFLIYYYMKFHIFLFLIEIYFHILINFLINKQLFLILKLMILKDNY